MQLPTHATATAHTCNCNCPRMQLPTHATAAGSVLAWGRCIFRAKHIPQIQVDPGGARSAWHATAQLPAVCPSPHTRGFTTAPPTS
eukprot:242779-Chlamydomonas_euryale.AAC.1